MDRADLGGDALRELRELPGEDLDPRRAREIRDRAVALLERRRLRRERRLVILESVLARFVQPALAGALSVGFAAWVVVRSIGVLQRARGGFFWP